MSLLQDLPISNKVYSSPLLCSGFLWFYLRQSLRKNRNMDNTDVYYVLAKVSARTSVENIPPGDAQFYMKNSIQEKEICFSHHEYAKTWLVVLLFLFEMV